MDNEYNPDFRDLVKALHHMDDKAQYSVVDGRWQDTYKPEDTIVFVTDDAAKDLNEQTRGYYNDGYKVFAWRKPFGKDLNVFRQSLIILSQWKKILETIDKESQPFVYGISEAKSPLSKLIPKRAANED